MDEIDARVFPLSEWKRLALYVQVQLDILYNHSLPNSIRYSFKKKELPDLDPSTWGDDDDEDEEGEEDGEEDEPKEEEEDNGGDDEDDDDDDDGGRRRKKKAASKGSSGKSKVAAAGSLVHREVEAREGETMKDICSRIGTEYFAGCGFYQLLKKEKVSSEKQLVVWLEKEKRPQSLDGHWIRSQIGVSTTAKAVDITPNAQKAFQSIGGSLFVNSTSATRKFKAGDKVLLLVPGSPESQQPQQSAAGKKKGDITDEIIVKRSRVINAIAVETILHMQDPRGNIIYKTLRDFKSVPEKRRTCCFECDRWV